MNQLRYFLWLAQQSSELLLGLWQLTLILLVLIVVFGVHRYLYKGSHFERKHFIVFLPFFLTVALLLIGSAFPHLSPGKVPILPSIVIEIIFWFHLPLGALLVYKLKGLRWFAASVIAFEIWIGFACALVAGMSMTDKWL